MSQPDIAAIRQNYTKSTLSENEMASHPIRQFEKWWLEALASQIEEVNAMTLATASPDGVPAARIVLLKGFSDEGFTFFTNYHSDKGRQLEANPRACLVFFWKELERQVRITGAVSKTPSEESDAYFHSRPEASRVGAITSPQSSVITSREWLDNLYHENQDRMQNSHITRPNHWGGYIVRPITVEFWQGRSSRLHDRIRYTLEENDTWQIERLAP